MSLPRAALSASRLVGRRSASSAPVHPGYAKIEPIKKAMNVEDGNPVHIKGGSLDKVLFGVTTVACLLAMGLNVKTYIDLSYK